MRSLLGRISQQPDSLVVLPDRILTGASIVAGAKIWAKQLKLAGYNQNTILLIDASKTPSFIYLLIACLWEGIPLLISEPKTLVDFKHLVPESHPISNSIPGVMDEDGLPQNIPSASKQSTLPWGTSLILASSGSLGTPKLYCLGATGIESCLRTHLPYLEVHGRSFLCTLPWHHCFGLILDLLGALIGGALLACPSKFDNETIMNWIERYELDSMNAVPLMPLRFMHSFGLGHWLRQCRGGILGGAGLSQQLCQFLEGSQFRIGYGMTEASCGISLGEIGYLKPGYLGKPIGCDVKICDGRLSFLGQNLALGTIDSYSVKPIPQTWHVTQDMVFEDHNGLWFRGRSDHSFKLANGKLVHPEALENQLMHQLKAIDQAIITEYDSGFIQIRVSGFLTQTEVLDAMGELKPYVKKILTNSDIPLDHKGAKVRERLTICD